MITPISSQGSQRPWRSLLRNATKQPTPSAKRAITTAPAGLAQMAATCWGTPGRNRACRSGVRRPVRATVPESSSSVLPTTTASRATISSRNCQPLVSSIGRKYGWARRRSLPS